MQSPISRRPVLGAVDVAFRVDNESLAGSLTTEEIGILGKIGIEYLSKGHNDRSLFRAARTDAGEVYG
jgi:hypothetical protein